MVDERETNPRDANHERDLAFDVAAQYLGEASVGAIGPYDAPPQHELRDRRHQHRNAIDRGGQFREVVLPHPAGGERDQ